MKKIEFKDKISDVSFYIGSMYWKYLLIALNLSIFYAFLYLSVFKAKMKGKNRLIIKVFSGISQIEIKKQ